MRLSCNEEKLRLGLEKMNRVGLMLEGKGETWLLTCNGNNRIIRWEGVWARWGWGGR